MKTYLVCGICLWFGQALAKSPSIEHSKDMPKPGELQYDKNGRASCPLPMHAKTDLDTLKSSVPNARRFIHARGVGEILIAEKVPDIVNQLEGAPYDGDFIRATSSMEHDEAMAEGHFNMAGYSTIRLKTLDLVVTLAPDKRVLKLSAGPQLRTPEGTGVGSTLADLKAAHGGFSLRNVPEPYQCSVKAKGLPFVWFMFRNCQTACQGARALKVYVDGAHFDDSTQTWLSPRREPLPQNYTLPDGLYPGSSSEK